MSDIPEIYLILEGGGSWVNYYKKNFCEQTVKQWIQEQSYKYMLNIYHFLLKYQWGGGGTRMYSNWFTICLIKINKIIDFLIVITNKYKL